MLKACFANTKDASTIIMAVSRACVEHQRQIVQPINFSNSRSLVLRSSCPNPCTKIVKLSSIFNTFTPKMTVYHVLDMICIMQSDSIGVWGNDLCKVWWRKSLISSLYWLHRDVSGSLRSTNISGLRCATLKAINRKISTELWITPLV